MLSINETIFILEINELLHLQVNGSKKTNIKTTLFSATIDTWIKTVEKPHEENKAGIK